MLKRLFPSRWVRILAWTGAAVTWGTSVVAVRAAVPSEPASQPQPEPAPVETAAPATTTTPVPTSPEQGLVVLRYTKVPPPPPQRIVRTVAAPATRSSGSTTVKSSGS